MQKTIANLLFFLCLSFAFAQSPPQGINWQGVLRGANGSPLDAETVSIQFKINETTPNGTTVYTQVETVSPNANGMVNSVVGDVTNAYAFSNIDWENESYFLEVAVDVTGGTNYVILGTTQLVSVPYALHANTSESSRTLKDTTGNTQVITTSNKVVIRSGVFETFAFTNGKITTIAPIPNFGNNLQLEFKDGTNTNSINNVFPNVTSLPTPGNADYELNLNVRGNETLSARGDGTVRINDNYSLPTTDGNNGQALVTDGNGNIIWSTIFANNNYSLPTTDGANGQFIQTNGNGNLSWASIPYSISQQNTVFGESAGESLSIGARNVFMGYEAGKTQTVGSDNVMIGYEAGEGNIGVDNTFVGSQAGKNASVYSGSRNVFIGHQVGTNSSVSDRLYIDNSSTATPLIDGNFNANALKVNGTFETTSNTTVGGTLKIGTSSTLSGIYKVSVSRNIGNIGGNSSRIETFTVSGASPGDVVFVSPSENLQSQVTIAQAWVSGNNTVSVRFRNTDGGSQDPDGGDGATYYISVIK